jgi:hypothetical protein
MTKALKTKPAAKTVSKAKKSPVAKVAGKTKKSAVAEVADDEIHPVSLTALQDMANSRTNDGLSLHSNANS